MFKKFLDLALLLMEIKRKPKALPKVPMIYQTKDGRFVFQGRVAGHDGAFHHIY